jgi:hypothetical protein
METMRAVTSRLPLCQPHRQWLLRFRHRSLRIGKSDKPLNSVSAIRLGDSASCSTYPGSSCSCSCSPSCSSCSCSSCSCSSSSAESGATATLASQLPVRTPNDKSPFCLPLSRVVNRGRASSVCCVQACSLLTRPDPPYRSIPQPPQRLRRPIRLIEGYKQRRRCAVSDDVRRRFNADGTSSGS